MLKAARKKQHITYMEAIIGIDMDLSLETTKDRRRVTVSLKC